MSITMTHSDDHFADPDRIRHVRAHPLNDEASRRLAAIFKALGDPTRVRLLHALSHAELTVGDLARLLEMEDSLSAVSHHLRLLRTLRIVNDRREGRQVYYALEDNHITHLLHQSLQHVLHATPEVGPE